MHRFNCRQNLMFLLVLVVVKDIEKDDSGMVRCQGPPPCSSTAVRRDLASLSRGEVNRLFDAFRVLHGRGYFDEISRVHGRYFSVIHDIAEFLPWHRYVLYDLETQLRTVDPSLSLPYWDSDKDFSRPHASFVFEPGFLGGDGDPRNGQCVRTGAQADWTYSVPTAGACLERQFDGGNGTIRAWTSPEWTQFVVTQVNDYEEFREQWEHGLHNMVHFGIGGDMATQWSPKDMAFWFHHANVDRVWAIWQAYNDRHFTYRGETRRLGGARSPATLDDRLNHYEVRVGDIMRLGRGEMCYRYEDMSLPSSGRQVSLLSNLFLHFVRDSSGHLAPDYIRPEEICRSRMPCPKILNRKFFQDRGFNVCRGLAVQRRLQAFCRLLNDSGYCCPYVK